MIQFIQQTLITVFVTCTLQQQQTSGEKQSTSLGGHLHLHHTQAKEKV